MQFLILSLSMFSSNGQLPSGAHGFTAQLCTTFEMNLKMNFQMFLEFFVCTRKSSALLPNDLSGK